MPKLNLKFFTNDDFEEYTDPRQRQRTRDIAYRAPVKTPTEITAQDDSHKSFDFTYQASRHERAWLLASLGRFYEYQWFDDVLRMVKGGKEASVYQCLGNASTGVEFVAAKVYRPRSLRNLKNDSLYRESRANLDLDGHIIRDHGVLRAIEKRTSYGQEVRHASWLTHEFTTLQTLYAAGADVPVPYTNGENAILMGYIGGEDAAAPTLNTVKLTATEARRLFERTLHNIEIMLANDRIHGDLSAYNILYWDGAITLIDFPQTISPQTNRNAYRIFERDVIRVCDYFIHQGVRANPQKLAADLWAAHGYRLKSAIHPSLLNADSEKDRADWMELRTRG